MTGRVVKVATPLRLDLSSDLGSGKEETIVLARAVDVDSATEATLRVAVAQIDLETPGDVGFVFEACPVFLGPNDAADVVGNPVASISVQEVPAGRLLLDAFDAGFIGPVQVRVRCGQPTAGRMILRAYVDVVLKWVDPARARIVRSRPRHARPWPWLSSERGRFQAAPNRTGGKGMVVAFDTSLHDVEGRESSDRRQALFRWGALVAQAKRARSTVSMEEVKRDPTLSPIAKMLDGIADLRRKLATESVAIAGRPGGGRSGDCPRSAQARRDARATSQWSDCSCSADRRGKAERDGASRDRHRASPDMASGAMSTTDTVAIRLFSRRGTRTVLGPFYTSARCDAHRAEGPTPQIHCPVQSVGNARFEVATDAPLVLGRATGTDRLRRMRYFSSGAEVWIGGAVSVGGAGELEIEPVMVRDLPPGEYDLEITSELPNCNGRVRGAWFAVLEPLVEPDSSNHLGPFPLDGYEYGTDYPMYDVIKELQGTVCFPALAGQVRAGPIVVVGHGSVNCFGVGEPGELQAVDAATSMLRLLAANGFVAAFVRGTADTSMALAAAGFLRNTDAPLDVDLAIGEIPGGCGFIGHSRAGSELPAALSHINGQVHGEYIDAYLNPGYLEGEGIFFAHVLCAFAPPIGVLPEIAELEGDFPYWMVISGDHDGDSLAGNGVKSFDRISYLASAFAYPYYQANVWVRGLRHRHFFDESGPAGNCDPYAAAMTPSLELGLGAELVRKCCTMFMSGSVSFLPFFQARNLVGELPDDVLSHADEILWRLPIVPVRFFDRDNGASLFVPSPGLDAEGGATAGNLHHLAILTPGAADLYVMANDFTDGLLVEWDVGTEDPSVEFPLQVPTTVTGEVLGDVAIPSGLVLQVSAAVPPDGLPAGETLMTFRLGVRSGGVVHWVDLLDYGGWRLPDPVTSNLISYPTATAAVLSTISIPFVDFSDDADVLDGIDAIVFDLDWAHASGRLFVGSVYAMHLIGAQAP